MPYWEFFTPKDALTAEDKKNLSTDLAQMYLDNVDIPLFYTIVRFEEQPEDTLFQGGEPTTNFIRIVVDHIARHLTDTDPDFTLFAMATFENTIAPYIRDRGFDWEIHIDETPLAQWRVQGLIPPPGGSDVEKLWVKENRAIPYDYETLELL
jgi:phenylpyruvate tautomerase PptA (4-oxalocrotonate tautomerase family)